MGKGVALGPSVGCCIDPITRQGRRERRSHVRGAIQRPRRVLDSNYFPFLTLISNAVQISESQSSVLSIHW